MGNARIADKSVQAAGHFGDSRPGGFSRTLWRLADSRSLGPVSRARLRQVVVRLAPGPFDIEAEEIRLRAYPAENHSDRVAMARGRLPDRDERRALEVFLGNGGVFVDVGANVGLYALWAARRVGPAGRVLAIEPHPAMADRLRFNIAANGAERVSVVQSAVGEEVGTATLHGSAGGNSGQSSLLKDVAFRPEDRYTVAVRPLLDLVEEAGLAAIDVLKIDIEGFEDRALVPFLASAPDALLPRAVLLETDVAEHWRSDCAAALAANGYTLLAETTANAIYQHNKVENRT